MCVIGRDGRIIGLPELCRGIKVSFKEYAVCLRNFFGTVGTFFWQWMVSRGSSNGHAERGILARRKRSSVALSSWGIVRSLWLRAVKLCNNGDMRALGIVKLSDGSPVRNWNFELPYALL